MLAVHRRKKVLKIFHFKMVLINIQDYVDDNRINVNLGATSHKDKDLNKFVSMFNMY